MHERLRVPTVKDILLNALEGLCLRVDIAVEAGLEGADMPQYCLGLRQSLLAISDPSQSLWRSLLFLVAAWSCVY